MLPCSTDRESQPPPHKVDGTIISRRGCEPQSFVEFIATDRSHTRRSEDIDSLSTFLSVDDPEFDAPFESRSFFTLPSTSLKEFYLVTRGTHSRGRIRYRQDLKKDVGSPTVEVWQYHWDRSVRESIKLCILSHNSTSQGFGIFVSHFEVHGARFCLRK